MPDICRMGYFLTLLLGAALLSALVWKPAALQPFAGLTSGDVPRTLSGYVSGPDEAVPADVQTALASAALISRTYSVEGKGDPFNFVLLGGTDRSALHDPRSCLIGSGMQVEDDHLERLPGTQIEARTCHAVGSHAVNGTRSGGFDIIYFYLVNGRIVSQATQIRTAMLWSALLGRRSTPIYFLRFTRTFYSDPRRDAPGHAAMLHFATEMWTRLQPRLTASTRQYKGQNSAQQNQCCQYRFS